MADQRTKLREELSHLIYEGNLLLLRLGAAEGSPAQSAAFKKVLQALDEDSEYHGSGKPAGSKRKLKTHDFGDEYQLWYSPSLKVVEHLLPDRYDEFRNLYRSERRKTLDVETYGIADYIAGISVSRLGQPLFDTAHVTLSKLKQQIAILTSAESRLDSLLANITGVLEAGLLDSELAAARDLLVSRHLRSAGIVAGVVLERHLQTVLKAHNIVLRKKPTLANLNDALRGAEVYDVPQWRRVQHLTDVRNLCGHNAEREPQAEEVEDLVNGVEKVIKLVF